MVDVRNQNFVMARLADYCDFRQTLRGRHADPLLYMWEKLKEVDAPLHRLKQEVFEEAAAAFFWKVRDKSATADQLADLKQVLDVYLAPGDFADAMFHLSDLEYLADKERFRAAVHFFKGLRVHRLLDEEDKPDERRNPNWKRLVAEIYRRLGFPVLETVRRRKPLTEKRLLFLLRRCRYATSEYCAVFHFPTHPGDTFTPFILPRVEALVAANRRFLRFLRHA